MITKRNARNVGKALPGVSLRSELEHHIVVSEWLNAHGIWYFHVPNEGKRSLAERAKLSRMGLKKGMPDFIIPGPVNVAIELKKAGGRPSKEQLECLKILSSLGWITRICYGAEDVIKFLKSIDLVKQPLRRIA